MSEDDIGTEGRLDIHSIVLASRHRAVVRARIQRAIVLCGLVLLGLTALFPPRRAIETVNLVPVAIPKIAPRRFLFSAGLYEYEPRQPGRDTLLTRERSAAEIDLGRLMAEALLTASLTGIGFLAFAREPVKWD